MDYYRNEDILGCHSQDGGVMGIQYSVVTDLVTEPVDLPFFKQHARIDFEMDDALCQAYITAARMELEQWGQVSFGVKTMRITALELPRNWRLMYGPVDTVTTPGFSNVGDILKEGGRDISVDYTTTAALVNDLVRVSICRYAAGLYMNRENIQESKFSAGQLQDEAKTMLRPIVNISLF